MRLLSIGVALVGAPASLLVDLPAIGLDLPAAARILQRLQSVAFRGTTVVAACAPLSAGAYSSLDSIVALQGGRVAYAGPTGTLAPRPFSNSHTASGSGCQIGSSRICPNCQSIGRLIGYLLLACLGQIDRNGSCCAMLLVSAPESVVCPASQTAHCNGDAAYSCSIQQHLALAIPGLRRSPACARRPGALACCAVAS